MHYFTLIALAALLVGFGILHLYKLFRQINDPNRIPGPTLIPYIGRIHDLPINFMWLKFYEWANQCMSISLTI